MLRTVNRILLGLTGLGLLLLGAGVLVGGLDLARRWGFSPPDGFPFDGPDDVVLADTARTRFREDGWWWPAVFAALGLGLALLLWWLTAQLRRRRLREVLVDSGDGEGALLRGRAMENVLEAETGTMPGVSRARVALTGRRTAPRARVGMVLEPHASPAEALAHLTDEGVRHARESAGLARLPAEVRLTAVRHRAEKVL